VPDSIGAREELTGGRSGHQYLAMPVGSAGATSASVGVSGATPPVGAPDRAASVVQRGAMTADWTRVPYEVRGAPSNRITNEVPGSTALVLDVTSKPPGTSSGRVAN